MSEQRLIDASEIHEAEQFLSMQHIKKTFQKVQDF